MTDEITVGDIAAEFLQACGVKTAYGVISVHNIPLLDAIGRRNAIRFVPARGEAGAAHMADAHARVSDALGVVITSTGPGAANAAGGLLEAHFAGSPVLHITGQTATTNVDRQQGMVHDAPEQLRMMASVGKAAYRVRSANTALGVLTRAAAEALTPPRGPVSVEIPIDVLRTTLQRPRQLEDFSLPVPPALAPDEAALSTLCDLLVGAHRPMLWLGSGARHATEAAASLVDLGVPLVTSWNGRGVVDEDHPLTLGGLNGTPEIEEFYASVDLLIVAGSRLRGHETRDMSLALPARRAQIDVDTSANGRTYTSEHFVCADSSLTLTALARRVAGRLAIEAGYGEEVAALKARATEAYRDYLGPYRSFPSDLRQAMPRDAVWVRDVTLNNSTWGNRIFPVHDPRDNVYPVSAAIGPGLPFGIGAALGAGGRKVVSMCGDGAFYLSLAEIWTAADAGADVVFLVMNDGGYGVIRHIQDRLYGGRHVYDKPSGPDFEALAALARVPFRRVTSAAALGPTVAESIAIDGPVLVEVNMAAIGTFPPYFVPPPSMAAQKEKV